mgnify:FL=1
MKAIGKYIIVNIIEESIKTKSGLLLSSDDVGQLRDKKAEVITPGTDVQEIKSGDVVYYDKRSGYTMMIENEKYSVITEKDVVVVV